MAKNTEMETPAINLIGTGTVIKGDIRSNGDIRIDGTLIGSVHSKGKVILGPSGSIEGEVSCQNGDISGTAKAQISVKELLLLKSMARLQGDIVTNKLAIEPGAKFTGSCNMNEGAFVKEEKPIVSDEARKTKESAS